MRIAMAVRERANCRGSRVGAILVLNDRIISTGYNGTPEGMTNCDDCGCHRCAHREKYKPGQSYDVCICVHAEENALLSAARFGIAIQRADLYSTMRPCFGCTKEAIQAKISRIFYLHEWEHPNKQVRPEYDKIQVKIPVKRIDIQDQKKSWAVPKRSAKLGKQRNGTSRTDRSTQLHLVKPRSKNGRSNHA